MDEISIDHMGFVILEDGTLELFDKRKPGELIMENFHFENAQRVIKKYHMDLKKYENSQDIDTLALVMSCYANDVVFLNTTKFSLTPRGILYLPKEESEEQVDRLLELEPFLSQFYLEAAKFKIVNKVPEIEESYESITDYYEALKSHIK